MKKLISLLLCALLLIACIGCKKETATAERPEIATIAGRYTERAIEYPVPEGFDSQIAIGVEKTNDALCIFTCCYRENTPDDFETRYYRHSIAADGSVTTTDEAWMNELAPEGGNSLQILRGSDGFLYASFSDYDEKMNPVAHILVSEDDGKTGRELTGDGMKKLGNITSFGVLGDGGVAAADFYGGTMLLLDAQGGYLEQPDLQASFLVPCTANGAYVAGAAPGGKAVRVINRADGSQHDWEFVFDERSGSQLTLSPDGTVYLVDATGLYRHAPDGTLWERLVDGEVCTLGLPNFYPTLLTVADGDDGAVFYVCNTDGVYEYTYDPSAAATDTELTVFSLNACDAVRQAVVVFNRTHGNVKVTYTVAMEGASGGTAQDYIKALNTELLAGTGPDILILDGLPIDSYIEKDVLMDLAEIVNGAEPVLANIRAASERDGKLYAMPCGVTVPMAVTQKGGEAAFDSLSALADAAEQPAELPFLSSAAFNYRTLALYLLKYYGEAVKAGDEDGLSAFLTDAKRVSEAIGSTEKLCEGWTALKGMSQDELYENFRDYIDGPQVWACASGTAKNILMQPMVSFGNCMEPAAVADLVDGVFTDVGGRYVPKGVIGVNKATAVPEAAAAFVQTLLSYDAQSGNSYPDQFPVNEAALAEMIAYENNNVSSGMNLDDGAEFTAMWPTKARREAIGAIIRALNAPIAEDETLTDMLLPEITAYLDGSSTFERALDQIASLMRTYLSE